MTAIADCACGCGGEPLPRRKYIRGHRPQILHNGYRRIWRPGHPMAHANGMALEHRVVLYDAGVLVPPGHQVHHLNGVKHDNRLENLTVIDAAEHTRLHANERTPTHCPHGHEYTPENTAFDPSGWRYCKTCNRERARARSRARAEVTR